VSLAEFWFLLIGYLFAGYFFLEGFDFGVGLLLPVIGHDDVGRRVLINTIGPVWDANETWLIVAGAAMFAAFPYWYASLFSGFYLALLLILLALILRGVAFEYRGKVDDVRWRRRWDTCIVLGSLVPSVLWGVAFANIVRGVPLDRDGNFTGTLLTLLNPYALLGGLVTVSLFVTHGAIFVALKTVGAIRHEARAAGGRAGALAAILTAGFVLWTSLDQRDGWATLLSVAAVVALLAALAANQREHEGWAFTLTGATIVLLFAELFVALFPNVLPSSTDPSFSLTVQNASSTPRTLAAMSWVALLVLPFVLIYEGWSYWVFRKRIGRSSIPSDVGRTAGAPTGH
jgi:cytochrome d ubiquinol oxidase subunit II